MKSDFLERIEEEIKLAPKTRGLISHLYYFIWAHETKPFRDVVHDSLDEPYILIPELARAVVNYIGKDCSVVPHGFKSGTAPHDEIRKKVLDAGDVLVKELKDVDDTRLSADIKLHLLRAYKRRAIKSYRGGYEALSRDESTIINKLKLSENQRHCDGGFREKWSTDETSTIYGLTFYPKPDSAGNNFGDPPPHVEVWNSIREDRRPYKERGYIWLREYSIQEQKEILRISRLTRKNLEKIFS